MEELLLAIIAGFAAGIIAKKVSDKAKSIAVFKGMNLKNSKDILAEANKAREMGADSAAILLAYGAIESRLRQISGHNESSFSVTDMVKMLESENRIDPEISLTIRQLSKVRNETSHGETSKEFSKTKVTQYIDRATSVLKSLEQC